MTSSGRIADVSYISEFESKYQKGMEMAFRFDGKFERKCEFNRKMSSVAILLFHRNRDQFMLVKQFRPAVFTSFIAALPENEGKELNEIQWDGYDPSIGETVELCAGLIDKPGLTAAQIAAEEIAEECGYHVSPDALIHVTTLVVGSNQSGNAQYLYYAEVDDAQKISEGGGNVAEGEAIQKVFVTIDEARAIARPREEAPADLKGPPGVAVAFQWWFLILDPQRKGLIAHPPTAFHWSPTDPKTISEVTFDASFDKKKYGYNPKRMFFTLNNMPPRSWDLALYSDSALCILVDMHTKELILLETFRPQLFVGRSRMSVENVGKDVDEIDFAKSDPKWAYSLELPYLRVPRHSDPRKFARIAVKQLGYDLPESSLHLVSKCVPGIGQSGDSQFLYVADAAKARRCEKEDDEEDVREVRCSFADLPALYNQRMIGSPNTYFAIGYVLDQLLETSTC